MTRDERNYPVEPPRDADGIENDPRFVVGLTIDVGEILLRRGYPSLTPIDFVRLQSALFRFIYRKEQP